MLLQYMGEGGRRKEGGGWGEVEDDWMLATCPNTTCLAIAEFLGFE